MISARQDGLDGLVCAFGVHGSCGSRGFLSWLLAGEITFCRSVELTCTIMVALELEGDGIGRTSDRKMMVDSCS